MKDHDSNSTDGPIRSEEQTHKLVQMDQSGVRNKHTNVYTVGDCTTNGQGVNEQGHRSSRQTIHQRQCTNHTAKDKHRTTI